jgi:hypothetical protein
MAALSRQGYTLMMFQRLAIANGHGWNRFLHTVDQVLPRRGETLPLPFEDAPQIGNDEAAT